MTTSPYVRFTLSVDDAGYREVVETLAELPSPGWQEEESEEPHRLTFWLPASSLTDPSVEAAVKRLQERGRCRAEPEAGDWERRWADFHHPVQVGRVLVRPPWAAAQPDALDVVVEVGMAFGTGGHITTRQCLSLLQEVERGALLDVGCGSGVLAIAGVRLGFAPVTAVDIDDTAVSAAAANALLNGTHIGLRLLDATLPHTPLPPADVVVANVALKPVVALGARVSSEGEGTPRPEGAASGARVAADGRCRSPRDVILAGLLDGQADEALAAWPSFDERERRSEGGWTALRLRRRRPPRSATGDD